MRTLSKIFRSIRAFSLLFGAFLLLFAPLQAQAGFFSSILGDEASANTIDILTSKKPQSEQNLQNVELLQANISSVSILQDKNKKEDGFIDENTNINIISDNALLPSFVGPGLLAGTGGYDFSSLDEDISFYVVRSGDTVNTVAKIFDVSPDTIYSANDMKKGDKLKEGTVLLILPFSGVEHTVTKGETLKSIASKYKVDLQYILDANDIDEETKITAGKKLMIPGADMLSPSSPKNSAVVKGGSYSSMPLVAGYFKNPVPGARKSRGVQPGHKGVDMAAPIGTPIYAAAEGTILIARAGWNGGFGNYVVIQHPNGVKTLYAHMSRLGTTAGARVSQGEVIGYVGSTGHSTGPHLHFETIGAKNPF